MSVVRNQAGGRDEIRRRAGRATLASQDLRWTGVKGRGPRFGANRLTDALPPLKCKLPSTGFPEYEVTCNWRRLDPATWHHFAKPQPMKVSRCCVMR
jgi:hypothetical protein